MGRGLDCVPIVEIAARVQRPESVDSTKTYRLLGAHWYAKGLYVKDEKPGAEIRASKLFAVRAGDFVYNRLFAWKGSFAVAQAEHDGCFVSGEFPCFQLDGDRISAGFLWLYFSRQTAWQEALGLSTGSTPTSRNRLKESQFLGMQIPLPPLDEQRRIVAHIDKLAALIKEAQELRAKAREETGNILLAALAEVFGTATRGRWRIEVLGQVARTASGGTPSRSIDQYFGGQIPWVKSGELTDAYIHACEEMLTEAGLENSGAKLFPSGTVLVAMYGANVGKTGILGLDAATNQAVCAVFPDECLLDRRFVQYFFRWKRRELLASTLGGAQPNISQRLIRALEIRFPDVAEQQYLVTYLDAVEDQADELLAAQEATKAELDALLPSVLDRAFKGEL